MTDKQAAVLMARLVAAFPTTKATEATFTVYLDHLVTLPYEWTDRAVKRVLLTHAYPSLPTIADLTKAAGITDDDSRRQFLDAMDKRRPLVRDAASVTGWAVGEALYPPEALPVATPALMGPVVSQEKRNGLIGMVKALAGRAGGMSWS